MLLHPCTLLQHPPTTRVHTVGPARHTQGPLQAPFWAGISECLTQSLQCSEIFLQLQVASNPVLRRQDLLWDQVWHPDCAPHANTLIPGQPCSISAPGSRSRGRAQCDPGDHILRYTETLQHQFLRFPPEPEAGTTGFFLGQAGAHTGPYQGGAGNGRR